MLAAPHPNNAANDRDSDSALRKEVRFLLTLGAAITHLDVPHDQPFHTSIRSGAVLDGQPFCLHRAAPNLSPINSAGLIMVDYGALFIAATNGIAMRRAEKLKRDPPMNANKRKCRIHFGSSDTWHPNHSTAFVEAVTRFIDDSRILRPLADNNAIDSSSAIRDDRDGPE